MNNFLKSYRIHPLYLASAALLLFSGALLMACDNGCSCGGTPPVAELITLEGEVTRDFRDAPRAWKATAIGDGYHIGDAVRTGNDSNAKVKLSGGGGLVLVADTVVRFLSNGGNGQIGSIGLEMGSATVESGDQDLLLVGDFGEALIRAGTKLVVEFGDGTVAFDAMFGSAVLSREGRDDISITPDKRLLLALELGDAVIDPQPVEEPVEEPLDLPEMIQIAIEGRGVQRQGEDGQWVPLDSSTTEVPVGSLLKVTGRAEATVSRGGESHVLHRNTEALIGTDQGELVGMNRGYESSAATENSSNTRVPGGVIAVRKNVLTSRADIHMRGDDAVIHATRGTTLIQGNKESYLLRTGETATLLADGRIESQSRAPSRAHLEVRAGESVTVHAPKPPVSVRVNFRSKCSGEGLVEIARGGSFRNVSGRSFGEGAANVRLPSGNARYRVRCSENGTPSDAAVADGVITIRRDSGRAQLPRRPTRNVVDTDGRRYTILYQNHLPIVMARWSKAPGAGPYNLHLKSGGSRAQVTPSNQPMVTLNSGEVPEGTHTLWFEAGGAKSKETVVRVSYDNASPACYLQEPAPSAAIAHGASVKVSGVAVEGWAVHIGGTPISLDHSMRFSTETVAPNDLDGIVIRLTHPRFGTHLYLRRVGGTP